MKTEHLKRGLPVIYIDPNVPDKVETTKSSPNSTNAVLNKGRKYWYVVETTACVLCGREKVNRYRVYEEPKPEQKHIWKDDACDEHFM